MSGQYLSAIIPMFYIIFQVNTTFIETDFIPLKKDNYSPSICSACYVIMSQYAPYTSSRLPVGLPVKCRLPAL